MLGEDFSDRESVCSCDEGAGDDEEDTALEEKDRFVAMLYKYYDDRGMYSLISN